MNLGEGLSRRRRRSLHSGAEVLSVVHSKATIIAPGGRMEEGPCMMAEYEYEEAVRKFEAARRNLELVEAEIKQQGSSLERQGRLKWSQQTLAQAQQHLTAKIRAWEACKQRELNPPEDE